MDTKKRFTQIIIEWHSKGNKRIMPWKGENNPYKIWISEIILQQTRVVQGLSYYNNFISLFPTIQVLASAPEEAVFKAWEGLGYYSRCKNIIYTAKEIVLKKGGIFPDRYDEIIALKGIGPYTAAAISSFAFGLPYAVVDGNVFRVLSRFFGDATAIDSTKGKEQYKRLADELLYQADPAAYNQAIMDFGATVCKPQLPICDSCVFSNWCVAYKTGTVNILPVKEKKLTRSKRWFTFFLFIIDGHALVTKRTEKDIWEGLYEFYLVETEEKMDWDPKKIGIFLYEQLGIKKISLVDISEIYRQQLTHQTIEGRFIRINLTRRPAALTHFLQINQKDFRSLAFPKFINQYLEVQPLFS